MAVLVSQVIGGFQKTKALVSEVFEFLRVILTVPDDPRGIRTNFRLNMKTAGDTVVGGVKVTVKARSNRMRGSFPPRDFDSCGSRPRWNESGTRADAWPAHGRVRNGWIH
jgi:hypothetical protein